MFTIDELMCACISRQIEDGELVAQGIATPLVAAGYLLARLTHAPNLTFVSAIGQSICRDWAPLSINQIERLWIEQGMMTFGFTTAVCDLLPRYNPKEFFRPGQVDAHGNFNNVFMGGTLDRPRLRLPGVGGIPDVTPLADNVCLYVPRHGRYTFVPRLDFCSGLGRGTRYLVSDLAQFDFGGTNGRMRLISLHPGVTLERLQARTSFAFDLPDVIPETPPPTAEELHLLRELIDPLGVRTLETLRGAQRRRKLRAILTAETEQ